MFGSLDPEKLLIVFVAAIIILGPDKLPKLARQMAVLIKQWQDIRDKSIGELRSGFKELTDLEPPRYGKGAIGAFLFGDAPTDERESSGNSSISGGLKSSTETEQNMIFPEEIGEAEDKVAPVLSESVSITSDVRQDQVVEDYSQDIGSGFYEPSIN